MQNKKKTIYILRWERETIIIFELTSHRVLSNYAYEGETFDERLQSNAKAVETKKRLSWKHSLNLFPWYTNIKLIRWTPISCNLIHWFIRISTIDRQWNIIKKQKKKTRNNYNKFLMIFMQKSIYISCQFQASNNFVYILMIYPHCWYDHCFPYLHISNKI